MKPPWYLHYFDDKKITIMGLGILGRGIADAKFLFKNGASLILTDKKSRGDLLPALKELEKVPGSDKITYHFGKHSLNDFAKRDMVLKAASVPLDSEYIAYARKHHIPVEMSAALLVRIVKEHFGANVTVIGVTGTRGKSTTTMLIAHVIASAGKRVHVGGNVRGAHNLPLLSKVKKGDCIVMELDSWQLQGFGESKISPDIAVFTSFLDDHLNYYHGDRELYFTDKSYIFQFQKREEVLIVSHQAKNEIKKRFPKQPLLTGSKSAWVDQLPARLIGQHNRENIRLACSVAEYIGLTRSKIAQAIETARPEEGRLEYIGKLSGIHVYDDNNATSPDAVIAAIAAVRIKHPGKVIHLLCGGADKNISIVKLIRVIKSSGARLYMLSGNGTERFIYESELSPQVFSVFEDAVAQVFSDAKRDEVFIFSPGFASFGMFKNEYDREDQFKKLLKEC